MDVLILSTSFESVIYELRLTRYDPTGSDTVRVTGEDSLCRNVSPEGIYRTLLGGWDRQKVSVQSLFFQQRY